MQDYTKLEIWKEAIEIGVLVYKLCEMFPKTEQFGLISQMQRAAVSISSNIAEGSSRRSKLDFIRFLEFSLGSCFEIESQLFLSEKIGLIKNPIQYEVLLSKLQAERKMIYIFIQRLQ
ncbi:MAG: ribosomal protein [Bacteroidetes bacterium]|nr:ribosomal protein [Bacteroidota bacterium]